MAPDFSVGPELTQEEGLGRTVCHSLSSILQRPFGFIVSVSRSPAMASPPAPRGLPRHRGGAFRDVPDPGPAPGTPLFSMTYILRKSVSLKGECFSDLIIFPGVLFGQRIGSSWARGFILLVRLSGSSCSDRSFFLKGCNYIWEGDFSLGQLHFMKGLRDTITPPTPHPPSKNCDFADA